MKRSSFGALLAAGAIALLMGIATASASAAFQVETLEATERGPHSVTLKAKVYREGGGGYGAFEWGETTSYGTETETIMIPAGTGWYNVQTLVTGLKPRTTYNFRFGAWSEKDQKLFFGNNKTVKTTSTYFSAEEYPAQLGGGGYIAAKPVIGVENGTFSCGTTLVEGELSLPGESVQLTPSFSECKLLGQTATVNTNGCVYEFHSGSGTSGTMDIDCPAGKAIEVTGSTCAISIGAQSGLSSVDAGVDNSAKTNWILRLNVAGLNYTKTKDGFACGFSGFQVTGPKEDGTYTGNFGVSGKYIGEEGWEPSISLGFIN